MFQIKHFDLELNFKGDIVGATITGCKYNSGSFNNSLINFFFLCALQIDLLDKVSFLLLGLKDDK